MPSPIATQVGDEEDGDGADDDQQLGGPDAGHGHERTR